MNVSLGSDVSIFGGRLFAQIDGISRCTCILLYLVWYLSIFRHVKDSPTRLKLTSLNHFFQGSWLNSKRVLSFVDVPFAKIGAVGYRRGPLRYDNLHPSHTR